ncbi:hypothetical protein BMBtp4_27 [Bacillus phage vB_BtS_BMBtp16]|nr:hypothetical protein BMBtp4_27 [Bacillus phage vB_BtS_BMBtp16]
MYFMLMTPQDGNDFYYRMAPLNKSGAIRALWEFSVFC